MNLAIGKARAGIRKGQSPFGACIVRDAGKGGTGGAGAKPEVVACTHNTVWKDTDSTAHAEINAIRSACRKLKTVDLSGCTIYSTTEPCPMCFSAIHWAKIDKIVFGASIADAKKAGFSELSVSDAELKKKGKSPVAVEGGFMKEECKKLFVEWKKAKGKAY